MIDDLERHSRYLEGGVSQPGTQYASRIFYRHPSMQTDFVATCCEDGKPAYLTDAGSKQRLFTAIKASCALPII